MSANVGSELPIKGDDLFRFKPRARELLTSVAYDPKKDLGSLRANLASKDKKTGWSDSRQQESVQPKSISIMAIAKSVNGGDELSDEHTNVALNTLLRGLQIGLHLASLYGKFSGLDTLQERNSRGTLTNDSEVVEWNSKKETHAAITIFVAAYYVTWKLALYETEMLSGVNVDFVGLPESIALSGQMKALQSTLFHYGSYLKGAQSGLEFVKLTQLYFKAVLDEMKSRSAALKFTDVFTDKNYKLDGTSFTVAGFYGEIHGAGTVVEFKPVDLKKIVGNQEGKRYAWRIAQALVAYCFETRKNPMVEIGAFAQVCLLKGMPGTGKTLLIGAILTMVGEYCKALGLPFRPHPLPNTIVSTFQGGSAEHMENWMAVLRNPMELLVGIIDDAENVLEERTRQGVSSGVREVIATFLRGTEGATAINRGNSLIVLATNIPDQIDKAVMSRVIKRVDVDGARRREDFLDQMKLWSDPIEGWKPGFVDLSWPNNYQFLSAQGLTRSVERVSEEVRVFKDSRLSALHDELRKKYRTNDHDFYGHFFEGVRSKFPFFTSRDVRNIQAAVMTRLFDFDFPEAWLTDRVVFVEKSYEEKRGLILDLAREQTGGRKFSDLLFEEVVEYLDTMVSILDSGFERQVVEYLERLRISTEAESRFRGGV